MSYRHEIDEAIEAAAAAKFGTASVRIVRYPDTEWNVGNRDRIPWFALFVGGECLGRRRTKGELRQLIESRAG